MSQCCDCIYCHKLLHNYQEDGYYQGYCCDVQLHCSDYPFPVIKEVYPFEKSCETFISNNNKRLNDLMDNMAAFLEEKEEEVPMDYSDIKMIYNILKSYKDIKRGIYENL